MKKQNREELEKLAKHNKEELEKFAKKAKELEKLNEQREKELEHWKKMAEEKDRPSARNSGLPRRSQSFDESSESGGSRAGQLKRALHYVLLAITSLLISVSRNLTKMRLLQNELVCRMRLQMAIHSSCIPSIMLTTTTKSRLESIAQTIFPRVYASTVMRDSPAISAPCA